LLPEERPAIYHQTGEKHLQKTQQAYAAAGVAANIVPFIKEMDQAYGWADIVLCRAGALTVAELCAVGLGAIFVPFPYAADDHQTANAVYMVKNSAALLIAQSELTAQRLANLLKEFASLPEKRLAMAQAAYKLRHVDVAEKIYHVCEEVCP
jgi:UDP-N-acetylglucosamine--N-acetylmuramyl-(pentapeptide) pyrophosphoryl-undecaprenol N-acetylglucosamine transferase